jgi:hypothetical protein
MRLPFSREQFFAVLTEYNDAVWPIQILLALVAVTLVVATTRTKVRTRWIAIGIAALWIWMAIAYHLAFFAEINPAAMAFAVLFLVEATLIAWYGMRAPGLEIRSPRHTLSRRVGWLLIVYALVLYPVIGYALGRRYPSTPTFGLPCPTTIFTLGLFAWSVRPIPWAILVVPIAWAVIGTSAVLQLGVLEDLGLPIAAVLLVLTRRAGHSTVGARSAAIP